MTILEIQNAEHETTKIVIGLSNVLTWANTKPDPQEAAFAEEDYRKRKPHPNYRHLILLEKMVTRLQTKNEKIKSFVICSGLPYGEGEDGMHFLFKMAWLGQSLPFIDSGENIIPTIHIMDLASVVYQVIIKAQTVEDRYLLAVDNSSNSLKEITEAIFF